MNKEQFKANRKSLNLTQTQLADKLSLSPKNGKRYVRMIEKGNKEPSGVLIGFFELIIKEKQYISMITSYQLQILNLKRKLIKDKLKGRLIGFQQEKTT